MRRDQDLTLTKADSQTDLIVIEDGDLDTAEWLDLANITASDIVYEIAEGTVGGTFSASDVVYTAADADISVVEWGSTDAQWPSDADLSEPPDTTLIIQVEIPPTETDDLLVSPLSGDTRTAELVRQCKIETPDDFTLGRTQITVVQGDVTVLPSTDDTAT